MRLLRIFDYLRRQSQFRLPSRCLLWIQGLSRPNYHQKNFKSLTTKDKLRLHEIVPNDESTHHRARAPTKISAAGEDLQFSNPPKNLIFLRVWNRMTIT